MMNGDARGWIATHFRVWIPLLMSSCAAAPPPAVPPTTAPAAATSAALPPAAPSPSAPPPASTAAAPANRPRFVIKHDANVMVKEPAPHQGVGDTTAYRYFDEVKDAGVIFRKRALHPGSANGLNVLKHDEVFYVLSGRGELEVDGTRLALEPGTAVFVYLGAAIYLRQVGAEDLVVIIAYPPARKP